RRRSQRARSAQRADGAAAGESAAGESAAGESATDDSLAAAGGAAAEGLRRARGEDGFFKGLAPCREETGRAKARRASGRPKRALRDAPRRKAAWRIWM
ncbi:hypothetical protein, partial [Lysobacter enzymogenes]|uniref:hypothetical protein n=1 Tax=Lysobacter enzymogenes TaxID=69 RepID=UPI0019D03702